MRVRRPCPFSERQLEVIRRMADGEPRRRIARDFNIKYVSLNTAVLRMSKRVGAADGTALVALALRAGWIK
jgi:DNA-binding NarL/FixJ family response regulator